MTKWKIFDILVLDTEREEKEMNKTTTQTINQNVTVAVKALDTAKEKGIKDYQKVVEELFTVAVNLLTPLQYELPNIKVEASNRLKRALGQAVRTGHDNYRIQISTHHLKHRSGAESLDTMIHEILHCLPECFNHGKHWKHEAYRVNELLGMNIDTKANIEITEEELNGYNHAIQCKECGTIMGYMRRTKAYRSPELYRCICGGELERIK